MKQIKIISNTNLEPHQIYDFLRQYSVLGVLQVDIENIEIKKIPVHKEIIKDGVIYTYGDWKK